MEKQNHILPMKWTLTLLAVLFLSVAATAQVPDNDPSAFGPSLTPPPASESDSVTVTVILKHQQDKNLSEIRRRLESQGFWDLFPPADCRVVAWNISLGFGHIIVLRVPANSVRRLNLALENGAWGAYTTEVLLSYDYLPVWKEYMDRRNEAKDEKY
jgi:hypothetical protein